MVRTQFHLPDALQAWFYSRQAVNNFKNAERCKCCDKTGRLARDFPTSPACISHMRGVLGVSVTIASALNHTEAKS